MKKFVEILAVSLVLSVAGFSQQKEKGKVAAPPAVGGGHIPQHGPPPAHAQAAPQRPPEQRPAVPAQPGKAPEQHAQAPAPKQNFADHPGHPNRPHVDANDIWVGHNYAANDPRFHLAHPLSMGASPEGLAPATNIAWLAEALRDSGSAALRLA